MSRSVGNGDDGEMSDLVASEPVASKSVDDVKGKVQASDTKDVWIAILAAGASRRMGQQKLLLPLPDGRPLIQSVVGAALEAKACRVLVVIDGANAQNGKLVREAVAAFPVTIVENRAADVGQSTSIHCAVAEVQRQNGDAILFLLGDEPQIQSAVIDQVLFAYRTHGVPLAQAKYEDGYGHPVLFDRTLFRELFECVGDEGGRRVVAQHLDRRFVVPVQGMRPPDVDTPEAYETLLLAMRASGNSHT